MPAKKSASTSARVRASKSSASREAVAKDSPKAVVRKNAREAKTGTAGSAPQLAGAVTTITMRIDLGFGNQLYIRGDGPGLSWERGVPAANTGPDLWTFEIRGADRPFGFKCLVNDEIWSNGDDFTAPPGGSIVVAPTFG